MENLSTNSIFENGIWKGDADTSTEWRRYRSILLERLRKFPERVGQIDAVTDRTDTYHDMADRAVRCAVWLRKQNLKPDDIIGVCTYNQLDTFVPVIASILAGHIFNPWWNAVLDNDYSKYFLNLTDPKIIFADDITIDTIKQAVNEIGSNAKIIAFKETPGFESLEHIIQLQTATEVIDFQCKDLDDIKEPVVISYTSGSTGYPKGVLLSYSRLVLKMAPISEEPSINFWTPAICWGTGLSNMLSTIISCSTGIVRTDVTEEIIGQILEKYKVTKMLFSNTAVAARMSKLESMRKYDFSSVRLAMFGGVRMLPEIDEFLMNIFPNALIANGYGTTEANFICLRYKKTRKLASCGQVVRNGQIKIIDVETGKILRSNEEGEIYTKTADMMLRYYKDEESTKAAFDEEGWFRTGDLAYYDEDGDFFIVDRMKELIKFRNNIHIVPSTIESVILKHPDVLEVAVVSRPHVTDAEHPMAFVSRHPNATVTEHEIAELVTQNLPDHMALRGGVVFLDELPHSNAGKILKKDLRQMARSLASDQ